MLKVDLVIHHKYLINWIDVIHNSERFHLVEIVYFAFLESKDRRVTNKYYCMVVVP